MADISGIDVLICVVLAAVAMAGGGFAGAWWGARSGIVSRWPDWSSNPEAVVIATAPFALIWWAMDGAWWPAGGMFLIWVAVAFFMHRAPGPGIGFPIVGSVIPPGRQNWRGRLTKAVFPAWRTPEAGLAVTMAGSMLYHAARNAWAMGLLAGLGWMMGGPELAAWALLLLVAGLPYQAMALDWPGSEWISQAGYSVFFGIAAAGAAGVFAGLPMDAAAAARWDAVAGFLPF